MRRWAPDLRCLPSSASKAAERRHEIGIHFATGLPYRFVRVPIDIEARRVDGGEEPIGELLAETAKVDHRRGRILVTLVNVDRTTVIRNEQLRHC